MNPNDPKSEIMIVFNKINFKTKIKILKFFKNISTWTFLNHEIHLGSRHNSTDVITVIIILLLLIKKWN